MQEFLKDMLLKALTTKGGVEKLYNEMTEEFRPFIDSMPKFAPVVGKDAATVAVTVLKIANEMAENEEVKAEGKRWKTRQILRRKEILDEYIDAGFSEEQAFEMLRLDVMNAKATLANTSTTVKSGK